MVQAETVPPLAGSDLAALSARASRLLGSFANARAVYGLTPEETAIFLAIGYLSLVCSGTIPALKPITYQDISALLNIPKATVRRKAIRLIDKKLVSATSRGVIIQDIARWSATIESIF
jgi:hypothetical protein